MDDFDMRRRVQGIINAALSRFADNFPDVIGYEPAWKLAAKRYDELIAEGSGRDLDSIWSQVGDEVREHYHENIEEEGADDVIAKMAEARGKTPIVHGDEEKRSRQLTLEERRDQARHAEGVEQLRAGRMPHQVQRVDVPKPRRASDTYR